MVQSVKSVKGEVCYGTRNCPIRNCTSAPVFGPADLHPLRYLAFGPIGTIFLGTKQTHLLDSRRVSR